MTNTDKVQNVCGLKREDFQTRINGKETSLLIQYGAIWGTL
mgnify:CR=1 FL=1